MSNEENPSWQPPTGPADFPDPSAKQSSFPPPAPAPHQPPAAPSQPPAAPYQPPAVPHQPPAAPYPAPVPSPYGAAGPAGYEAPKRKRRIWLWFLIGVPVFFALLIGGCSFLVFSFTRGPVDATNAYVAEMDNGNFDAAYDSLCSSVKAGVSQGEWVETARSVVGGEITGYNFSQVSIDGDAVVTGTIEVDGITRTAQFDLVEEDGDWRVCSINPAG